MNKVYQVKFAWKSPLGKRVTSSSSPFVFNSYEEADEYGSTLLFYERKKAGLYKYRHTQLIIDFEIDTLIVDSASYLIESLKRNYKEVD